MGLQGVHWDFFPKTDSGRVSDYPQRIFSLSLEDSKGWKAADKDTGLVPASDFEKGDLSLARSSGREKDAGDYRCRMEFNNSRSLERKVHVHVLQSELKQALTSAVLFLCFVASAPSQPNPLIVFHKKSLLVFSLYVAISALMHFALVSSLAGKVYLDRLGRSSDVFLIQTFNRRPVPTGHNELPLRVITQ